jgi:hypothetical protein
MRTLSLGKLKPGMTLAEPAHNFQGVLLLDAGSELSEKDIRVLKTWGVTKVCVEGKSEDKRKGDAGAQNEARLAIEKELNEKFSGVPKNPVMVEIMRVAGKLLEKRLLMKEGQDEIS